VRKTKEGLQARRRVAKQSYSRLSLSVEPAGHLYRFQAVKLALAILPKRIKQPKQLTESASPSSSSIPSLPPLMTYCRRAASVSSLSRSTNAD
jgi:hypothetical protein